MNKKSMVGKQEKRRNILLIIVSVLIIISCSLMFGINYDGNKAKVTNGEYRFDNNTNAIQSLNGTWAFAWNDLKTAQQMISVAEFQKVPGFWNNYSTADEYELPAFGYATFGVKVKGLETGQEYTLKLPTVGTAGKFYIDNQLISETGVLATQKQNHRSQFKIAYIDFVAKSEEIFITAQISNFDYARAGLWLPIQIAKADAMLAHRLRTNGIEYGVVGMLVFALIISLAVITILKAPKASYYFIGTIIFMFIYNIVYGDKLLLQWCPNASMWLVVKLQYLVMYILPILCARSVLLFCGGLKRYKRLSEMIFNILTITSIIMSLSVLFAPLYFSTKIAYIGKVFAYFQIALVILLLVEVSIEGNPHVVHFLFSGLILAICLIHDFLYRATLIDSVGEIAVIGYVFVLASLGAILLVDIIRIQAQAKMSDSFERAYLNSQIKSHFLFNALNTIASVVHTDAKKAENLTLSLSTFLRNIVGRQNLKEMISLDKELETVISYAAIEQARFDKIKVKIDIKDTKNILLPPMTLQPIVENSIKHGLREKSSGGIVTIFLDETADAFLINIADNGVGMDKNTLGKINKELSNHSFYIREDAGIGLINVNARIYKTIGTIIDIESEKNIGTTVRIIVKK